jgi:hypothetical protein
LEPRLDPEEDIVEGFAVPDNFTEATLALEFPAQDDVLFFQLKLQPIGIGGHITDNSTISAIAEIVPRLSKKSNPGKSGLVKSISWRTEK